MSGNKILRKLKELAAVGMLVGGGAAWGLSSAGGAEAEGDKFQPIKEAETPKGFPDYTPIGAIEIKQYPAYRKAEASGAGEFWTLFQHIKTNKVQMTAPVEMDYGDPRAAKPREQSMAFLYERPDQGSKGKQGRVDVVDVPAMTVVSIGCRGSRNAASIEAARGKLLAWLDLNKQEYAAAGQVRVMGYNSPFVPRDKNYFEVQIPVRAAKATAVKAGNP